MLVSGASCMQYLAFPWFVFHVLQASPSGKGDYSEGENRPK